MEKKTPKHGVPRGEKSSYGAANGSPSTTGYRPTHSAGTMSVLRDLASKMLGAKKR